MTQSIKELEQEIEDSRARLDLTIDRIQDRMSVSGIMDELVGSVRGSQYGSVFDTAIEVVRRNPVPLLLVAAGVGWLLYRMNQNPSGYFTVRRAELSDDGIPVLNTGQVRVYDPDTSPRHPSHDALETRRDASARA